MENGCITEFSTRVKKGIYMYVPVPVPTPLPPLLEDENFPERRITTQLALIQWKFTIQTEVFVQIFFFFFSFKKLIVDQGEKR